MSEALSTIDDAHDKWFAEAVQSDVDLLNLAERAYAPRFDGRRTDIQIGITMATGAADVRDGRDGAVLMSICGARRWEALEAALNAMVGPAAAPAVDLSPLSQRERELVDLLASGMRLSAISRQLGVSHHTGRNHLKHVFKKLGIHSQNELIARVGGRS